MRPDSRRKTRRDASHFKLPTGNVGRWKLQHVRNVNDLYVTMLYFEFEDTVCRRGIEIEGPFCIPTYIHYNEEIFIFCYKILIIFCSPDVSLLACL